MNDRHYVAHPCPVLGICECEYCVVGDSRQYPEAIPSDIDIVVPGRRLGELPRWSPASAAKSTCTWCKLIRHEQTAVYFVLADRRVGRGAFSGCGFCSDYLRGGRRLLGADEMLAHRGPVITRPRYQPGFRVPAPHMQFIYYLVEKVDKQDLNSRHGDYLSSLWQMDPRLLGQLTRSGGGPGRGPVRRLHAQRVGTTLRAELPRLRRAMRGRAADGRAPCRRVAGRISTRAEADRAGRGILGADGSGKSSVIDRVLADLAPASAAPAYLHLRRA